MPFETIEPHALRVVAGAGAWSSFTTGARAVGHGVSSGVGAVKNFGNGFVGGAIHGPLAQSSQIDRYGDSRSTGFKPGVETGMMFNMALGPIGGAISVAAGSMPTGSGGH